jgi:hypothetical protein
MKLPATLEGVTTPAHTDRQVDSVEDGEIVQAAA